LTGVPFPTVTTLTAVDAETERAVRTLIGEIARTDGRDPLSDQALTKLRSSHVSHTVARDGDAVVGYAQLDGSSLEVVALSHAIDALLDSFAGQDVQVWSHGQQSPLSAALTARGFVATRELHQLRRPLTAPVEQVSLPDGVSVRPFVPGDDEDAWVAVNAAAFASHPEQGRWTVADLTARENESWFDPSGFLMAWRGSELVGFHWTKIHDDGAGEVYVIGVSPDAQGLGLGKILLQLGLASLQERGCTEVLLYVDGDNTTALRLYERAGFHPHDLDVQWRSVDP
jgi:mycothiol synthase